MTITRAQIDYADLVDELADLEPNGGWQTVAQLPALSDSQLAICLRRYPEALEDAIPHPHRLASDIADCLDRLPLAAGLDALACAGEAVLAQARQFVREHLLTDLQEYAWDREAERESERARRHGMTGREYADLQHGVRGL